MLLQAVNFTGYHLIRRTLLPIMDPGIYKNLTRGTACHILQSGINLRNFQSKSCTSNCPTESYILSGNVIGALLLHSPRFS